MNFIGGNFFVKSTLRCDFHSHPAWEIIYQDNGHTDVTAGTETFRLHVGEVLVIPPEIPHNAESDAPFSHIYIQLRQCDFPVVPFTVRDTDGCLKQALGMLGSVGAKASQINGTLCEKLSELICLYIKKAANDSDCPEFVLKCRSALIENVGNPDFRLSALIEQTGYHPDYFRRTFKKHIGYSPLAYLNRLRFERAKELLKLERHLPIETIAAQCGFKDSLYFSNAFKKQEKLSPREFRKRLDTQN